MQKAKSLAHSAEHPHKWSKPLVGIIKCNVDAASFNNDSIKGYGMCFRDSSELFMFGKSDYYYSSTTILEAETIGLLEAIKVALSNGMHVVWFETDCKAISDALATTNIPQNEFGDLIFQCKSLLINRTDFVVLHIRRQTNKVAHNISRASFSNSSPHIFYIVPTTFYPLILNEIYGLTLPLLKKKREYLLC